ncbi:MAG: hypothetical protein ACO23H_14390 [Alphaproteobacteria bacterium]
MANGQSRRKGEEKVSEIGQVQNLPKTEAYPPSSPPSYIDIPTQNFLVILETGVALGVALLRSGGTGFAEDRQQSRPLLFGRQYTDTNGFLFVQ